jgi:hypothetical protein
LKGAEMCNIFLLQSAPFSINMPGNIALSFQLFHFFTHKKTNGGAHQDNNSNLEQFVWHIPALG